MQHWLSILMGLQLLSEPQTSQTVSKPPTEVVDSQVEAALMRHSEEAHASEDDVHAGACVEIANPEQPSQVNPDGPQWWECETHYSYTYKGYGWYEQKKSFCCWSCIHKFSMICPGGDCEPLD